MNVPRIDIAVAANDRRWIAGGAAGAIILVVLAWVFLISPQNALTSAVQDQADTAAQQLGTVQHRLSALRKQDADRPQYQARYALALEALPTTAATADLLRELQAAGAATGVAVTGVTVGAPAQVAGAAKATIALPVTVSATGAATGLEQFVNQLQQVQPRALLINNATVASSSGQPQLTLTMQAFVSG
jgi:Tfp pilus assembly protein PilO